MAGVLGVSRPTYMAIEKGVGSLTLDQTRRLADKLGYDLADILTEKIIHEKKYQEVLLETIRHGADTDGKITKTKLAKLVYLADFAWYYYHLESMTGASYRKLPQGPVPNYYFSAMDDLFDRGLINIEIADSAQLISLTEAATRVSPTLLSDAERHLIDEVTHKWKHRRTKEIVAFTHEQLPYKICSDGEVIPYELITQQDPHYVY